MGKKMSGDSLRLTIMAQELDRNAVELVALRMRVEQLEKALRDLEGRYIVTLPMTKDGAWTITPVPKFESCPP